MKTLTRVEAWKEIRAAFQEYVDTGCEGELSIYGLCSAVSRLYYLGKITAGVDYLMDRDIVSVRPRTCYGSGAWYWPTSFSRYGAGRKGALMRVRAINRILRKKTK